ncbi:STAS domain-containing protein [Phytohabitans sp. LJ34]|uniref:STAS domain-containing protein n=1 Tax=Phytohabitans sp. LJ34 TaxID=3452217 RepID=UPI003F89D486
MPSGVAADGRGAPAAGGVAAVGQPLAAGAAGSRWNEVTFLDCTGLAALVAVRNAAVQAGGQMRVSHPQPIVRRVLEVTGLLAVFTAPTIVPTPTGSGRPSRLAPALAAVTQPPDLMVAA